MTVAELIEELQKLPEPEFLEVVVAEPHDFGYECTPISSVLRSGCRVILQSEEF